MEKNATFWKRTDTLRLKERKEVSLHTCVLVNHRANYWLGMRTTAFLLFPAASCARRLFSKRCCKRSLNCYFYSKRSDGAARLNCGLIIPHSLNWSCHVQSEFESSERLRQNDLPPTVCFLPASQINMAAVRSSNKRCFFFESLTRRVLALRVQHILLSSSWINTVETIVCVKVPNNSKLSSWTDDKSEYSKTQISDIKLFSSINLIQKYIIVILYLHIHKLCSNNASNVKSQL